MQKLTNRQKVAITALPEYFKRVSNGECPEKVFNEMEKEVIQFFSKRKRKQK